MIPVSTAFRDAWRSGVFKVDKAIELYLPVNPTAVSAATTFSADFPASAILDGDRTHLNAGPNNGLYPPPAGPENFIGRGMWKSSAVPTITTPEKITITIGTQKVGMVRIYTHPSEGGVTRFGFTLKATSASSEVPITDILRARAWEQFNGRSTVTADTVYPGLGILNVTAVNTYRTSVPSVIEVVFNANVSGADATGQILLLVGENSAADGRARVCEIELFRYVDLTSRGGECEIPHGADIRNRTLTARQVTISMKNADYTTDPNYTPLTPADFLRPTSGQAAIDLRPEVAVFSGIGNELVQLGSFAIDNAQFDHVNRKITMNGRGRTERTLFDRPVSAWRTTIDLDDACMLVWTLANNPAGLTVVERNPSQIAPFNPGEQGWQELEGLRQAAQDRGIFVDGEGVLRFLSTGTVTGSVPTPLCTPHTEVWSTVSTPEGRGVIIPDDMLFFDPADGRRLYFHERTFRTYKPENPPVNPDPKNVNDCDDDRLTTWDMRSAFSTRTSAARVLGGAKHNPGPNEDPNRISVPVVMARRPGTDRYYFFTSSLDPKDNGDEPGASPFQLTPPAIMTGWEIIGGVATQILAAQTLPAGTFVTAAAFIGNVLYWWEAQHNTSTSPVSDGDQLRQHRLKKWDVTTAFAPITVATENLIHVRSMVSVGTTPATGALLLWVQNPGYVSSLRVGGTLAQYVDPAVQVWNTFEPYAWRTVAVASALGAGGFQPRRIVLTTAVPNTAKILGVQGNVLYVKNNIVLGTGVPEPWSASVAMPAVAKCTGAIAPHNNGMLAASFEGPATLRFWDLSSSTTTLLGYGSGSAHPSLNGITEGDMSALAISPTTWYGRRPVVAMETGTSQYAARSLTPSGRLFFWLLQEAVPTANETVPSGPFIEISERASYEVGGAVGGANAIDMTVHERVEVAGQQVFEGTTGDPADPHMVRLDDTANPTSLSPTPFRRHARYPKVAGGPTLLGTIATDDPRTVRQYRADVPSDDPANFSVDSLDSAWIVDSGVAYQVASAILSETRTGTRFLEGEVPLAPHLEVGDVLDIAYRQRTGPSDLVVTGLFRIVHLNHTMNVGESDAENRTRLELVLV